eukprot:6571978-Pyramimonas_sp.AAC.1
MDLRWPSDGFPMGPRLGFDGMGQRTKRRRSAFDGLARHAEPRRAARSRRGDLHASARAGHGS